jgi:hypothetical protein
MRSVRLEAALAWVSDVQASLGALRHESDMPAIERCAGALAEAALRLDIGAARALADELAAHGDYHRQLIAAAPGFTALLISWPRVHETPIHDHAELWGIELVVDGVLEVEEYRLDGATAAAPEFVRSVLLGVGDAAVFGGPHYAHCCRNRSATRAALSLHVYGGVLDAYRRYDEVGDGVFVARQQRARVDTHLIV